MGSLSIIKIESLKRIKSYCNVNFHKNIHSVKDFFDVIKNYTSGFSKCTDSVKEGKYFNFVAIAYE